MQVSSRRLSRLSRLIFGVFSLLVWLQAGSVLKAQVYFDRQTIDSNFSAYFVKAFDFDRDGDFDILSGHNNLAWWQNDGSGNFSKRFVDSQVSALWSIFPVDLDRDGDNDLLIADSGNHDIVWYKNNGGSFSRKVIESGFTNSESVAAADFDEDGHIDIVGLTVGTASESGIVVWWRNNGSNSFSRRNIDLSFDRGHKLDVADINNDGHMDIVAVGAAANGLVWWRGNGGGSFTKRTISSGGGLGMYLADMDGNGSLDVVSCDHGSGRVFLYYNSGSGSFSGGTIASGLSWPSFPAVGDLNQDGRQDVVVFNRDDNSVVWLENRGGSFTIRPVGEVYLPFVGDVADLTGDGVPDIVSGSKLDKDLYMWETTGPYVPKSIRVQRPNGGESYSTNTAIQIDWSSDGDVGSVEIEYSTDDGSSWHNVVSSTSNDGSYSWQPPQVDSDDCLIRVREAGSGDPSDVSDGRFSLTVPTYSLSGSVVYAGGLGPISGVDVRASGDLSDSRLTGNQGIFEMGGVQFGGDLSLTPVKGDGEDQSAATITSFDAAMAARAALGLEIIDDMQQKAADVDRSGEILLYDAAIIARHAVGLPALQGTYAGEWAFDPEIRTIEGVSGDLSSLDFTGIVLGDVSLSWSGGGISKAASPGAPGAMVNQVSLNGDQVELTFKLPGIHNVLSFDLTLSYGIGSYAFVSAALSPNNTGFNLLINDLEPGQLKVGGFSATALTQDTELKLVFASQTASPGEIVVDRFAINDGILITSVAIAQNDPSNTFQPTEFVLRPNYPNPFNSETMIGYEIDEPGLIEATIYDVQGRRIFHYRTTHESPGAYAFIWSGLDDFDKRVASGVYFLQFSLNQRPRSTLKITYVP